MTQNSFLQSQKNELDKLYNIFTAMRKNVSEQVLNKKTNADKWSALECMQHLILYGNYYIKVIEKAIQRTENPSKHNFEHSWLGKKSVESVSPDNPKKIKTFKHMNPHIASQSHLDKDSIFERLLEQIATLSSACTNAQRVDIERKKVPLEFFKLLNISIGDAIAFHTAHLQRHLIQIETAIR